MVHIYRRLILLGLFITLITTTHAQLQSVTYTITDVNSVNITAGQAPLHSQASYSQTGSTVGKMAAEQSTTLILSGYEGYTIKKVVLSMHSDKTQGAGGLDVKVADRRICQIPTSAKFDSKWWREVYFNEYFIDVTPTMRDTLYEIKEGQEVTIHILASHNHLYLESYTLYYEKVVYPTYQVTYVVNGHRTTLESNQPFAEILPLSLSNPITESDKVFVGWASTEAPTFPDDFIDLSQRPVSDTTLYAIFGMVDYQEESLYTSLSTNDRNEEWEYASCENLNTLAYFDITPNTEILSPPLYLPAITSIKADLGFRDFTGVELPVLVSDEAGSVLDIFHVTRSDYFLYELTPSLISGKAYGRLCFTIDATVESMLAQSGMKCREIHVYCKPYSFSEMTSLVSGAHIVHVSADGFTFEAGLLKTQMTAVQLQKGAEQPQQVNSFLLNPDGTYSLDFPFQVEAGEHITVRFMDADSQLLETLSFVMPLIVTTDKVLTDVPECDMYIQNKATCTIAEDMTLNRVEIEPGAALLVNEGESLSVASLRMCSENDTVARIYLKGTLENRTNRLVFDKEMDNQAFYFFSLPDTCGLSQITFSSGEPAVHGTDYLIKYYDGAQRTINQGLSSNWKVLSDTVLYPGVGYVIAVAAPNGAKQKLSFLLDYNAATATHGKRVRIYPHGAQRFHDNDLAAHHVGWNLVGNPSLGVMENESGVFYSYNDNTGESQTIPYCSYPIERGTTYMQKECVGDFPAFTAFFIQIGAQPDEETHDYYFQYLQEDVQGEFRMAQLEKTEPMKVILQISHDGKTDKTTIWLDDDYTMEYEIGMDLEKMMGLASVPHIYSINEGLRQAFLALPISAMQAVSVGAYFPSVGEYTIAMHPTENNGMTNRKVLFTDLHANRVIDLVRQDYTFNVDNIGLYNRFLLSFETDSSTPTDNVPSLAGERIKVYTRMGEVMLNGLLPKTDVGLLDASGRLLVSGIATYSHEYIIPVKQKGVYFIRLKWGNECIYVKVIL